MPQPPVDPVLIAFEAGTLLLSVTAGLFFLIARFGRPPLRYTPRRPVPWGAVAGTLAVLYVVTALTAALHWKAPTGPESQNKTANNEEHAERQPELQSAEPELKAIPLDATEQLLSSMVPQLLIVGGFVFVIAFFSRATSRDLGLPANLNEFAHDVFVGLVASLVALAPVHVIQLLLVLVEYWMNMGEKSGHPLVKMVTEGEPDLVVMLLAAFAAVVVAPICEEVGFRLLFQGWLEKWEDKRLGWRTVSLPNADPDNGIPALDATQIVSDELQGKNLDVVGGTNSSIAMEQPIAPPPPSDPPQRGVAELPYGWLPILVSSLLFGLAHLGYGPEPVPLFFLGLVLGYVYQRTHRIVPCIVAHAVFNLFTMVVLWRMVYYGAH